MNLLVNEQIAPRLLPQRMYERLKALGLTVVHLRPGGSVIAPAGCRWVERLILRSAPFAAAAEHRRGELGRRPGELVELWPGLWLVPLPSHRRQASPRTALPAVLLLGHELIEADQLRAVCDSERVDHRATVAKIDQAQMLDRTGAEHLARMLAWLREDAAELDRHGHEITGMSHQLANTYEELSLLYKLSSSMMMDRPADEFLSEACRELQTTSELRWMALQLVGEARLQGIQGDLHYAGRIHCDEATLRRVGARMIEWMSDQPDPIVVDDTTATSVPELTRMAHSLLVVPVLGSQKRLLGVLFGGDKQDGSHLSSVDLKLCNSLGNTLSIFLQNHMLYEDMHDMFLGTLHALTSAIDAKDSYTHGHSERVALLSRTLAEAAGFEEHAVERVYLAGLVHDVGKIGVPESVLCKPDRLTDKEFEQIKRHPEIGARILQDIQQMSDLVPGVLHHHERWDGRGYPYCLAGEDIPLFGRIIGLADSFDAMSSDRTYRRGMSQEAVLAEIRRCAGAQFDPDLAKVFVGLDFSPYFELIDKHQGASRRS